MLRGSNPLRGVMVEWSYGGLQIRVDTGSSPVGTSKIMESKLSWDMHRLLSEWTEKSVEVRALFFPPKLAESLVAIAPLSDIL